MLTRKIQATAEKRALSLTQRTAAAAFSFAICMSCIMSDGSIDRAVFGRRHKGGANRSVGLVSAPCLSRSLIGQQSISMLRTAASAGNGGNKPSGSERNRDRILEETLVGEENGKPGPVDDGNDNDIVLNNNT